MSIPNLLLALAAACLVAAPAASMRPRDQVSAFKEARRGKIMPLPRIEQFARAHPIARGAEYLGPEFSEATTTYRMKFMARGRVVWVDVDARNGRVLRTSDD